MQQKLSTITVKQIQAYNYFAILWHFYHIPYSTCHLTSILLFRVNNYAVAVLLEHSRGMQPR